MTTNLFLNDGEMPADIAEQLERKSKDEMVFDSLLVSNLNFTPEDLEANRDGVMTERQRIALEARAAPKSHAFTGAFILWGLITLGAVDSSISTTDKMLVSIVSLLLVATVAGAYSEWANKFFNDAEDGVVRELTGRVILDTNANRTRFTLTIGYMTFKLDRQAYLRFRHLDTYTIYYAPGSHIILSFRRADGGGLMNAFLYDGEMPADIAFELLGASNSSVDLDLAEGLDFGPEDLLANRYGEMTKHQVEIVKQLSRPNRYFKACFVLNTILVVSLMLAYDDFLEAVQDVGPYLLANAAATVLLLRPVSLWMSNWDVCAGIVLERSGQVTMMPPKDGRYTLTICEKPWPFPKTATGA